MLLHGDGGRHHAGMGVGYRKHFQYALEGAVLAGSAVQHVESDIRLDGAEHRCDVATHINTRDAIAKARKRLRAGFARKQRDFPLGRPASHQNRDVLAHAGSTRVLIHRAA